MTIKGSLAGDGGLYFMGETFTNEGNVSIHYFDFGRSGTQQISGTGQWTGDDVRIEPGSSTSLANDVTFQTQYVGVTNGAELNLMGHILTLKGSLAFDHRGFTGSNGSVHAEGTVSISQSGTFNPLLKIVSGTTTINGGPQAFNGPIEIAVGATLTTSQSSAAFMTVYGGVTVNGSLTGSGVLYFVGETFTNEGSVSIHYVDFRRSGTQQISGNGQWTGDEIRIEPGSNTLLVNDVTFQTQYVNVISGAELDVDSHTLTFAGDLRFDQRGHVKGSGRVRTEGSVLYFTSLGSQDPVLEVSREAVRLAGTVGDSWARSKWTVGHK